MHVWADLRVLKVIIIVIATHADTNAFSDTYVCTSAHGLPILLCMYVHIMYIPYSGFLS